MIPGLSLVSSMECAASTTSDASQDARIPTPLERWRTMYRIGPAGGHSTRPLHFAAKARQREPALSQVFPRAEARTVPRGV